jgi:hypothetical protein
MESVPAKGDRRTEMRWYWEAGHFKSALGDRVLARMFADSAAGSEIGRLVNAENIDAQQALIRSARAAYEQLFPDDVRLLQQMVDGNSSTVKRAR